MNTTRTLLATSAATLTLLLGGTASLQAASAAPAGDIISVERRDAVRSAALYLAQDSGFSYHSLINQLVHDGHTRAAAVAGVEDLEVDWAEQAALAASVYTEAGGRSGDSLVAQLRFEGFTPTEAEQAVN